MYTGIKIKYNNLKVLCLKCFFFQTIIISFYWTADTKFSQLKSYNKLFSKYYLIVKKKKCKRYVKTLKVLIFEGALLKKYKS